MAYIIAGIVLAVLFCGGGIWAVCKAASLEPPAPPKKQPALFAPCERWTEWADAPRSLEPSCVNCWWQYGDEPCLIFRARFLEMASTEREVPS